MSAMSIEWHKECLANSIASHKQCVAELERALKAEQRIREHNERYARQIALAEKLGKTKFDAERFGIE